MARSDTRYSIYPAPKAVEIVGNSAPALNQAIECWAALLARATADNAKTFYWNEQGVSVGHLTGKWEDMHALAPWGVLTEALKDIRFDPEFANPGELLATAVEDAHRMGDVAQKWFSSGLEPEEYARGLEFKVKELVEKLRNLDYAHGWALIVTIQWYWEHQHEGIDIKKDQWWTLAFRRQWKQAAWHITPYTASKPSISAAMGAEASPQRQGTEHGAKSSKPKKGRQGKRKPHRLAGSP
jgi:hypothetical protein